MAGRSRVRNPESKTAIVTAAERVVARDGAGNLTLDAVAAEAGMSKGGLLYNFPSKQALLEGMVETMVARGQDARATALAQVRPGPNAGIRARLAIPMKDVVERKAGLAILAAAAENPALLDPVRASFDETRTVVEGDAEDPEIAFIVWLAADALALWDVLGVQPFDAGERARIERRLGHLVGSEGGAG